MKLLKAVAIVLIVIWSVGPIVLGITTSLSTQREVNSIPTHWVPHHPTVSAYQALLNGSTGQSTGGTVTQGGDFVHAMTNSALIACGGAALTLIVATMAAYALGRLRFRISGAVLALLVGTLIIPIFVIVIGLFQIMANAQLIDTKRGLILVFVATQSPLATWLLYTQVRELPHEPEEAALIDGCRRWQAFVRVVVPQMSSGIAAVAAIIVLSIWGEFLIPLLLTSTMNSKPITVLITEYVGKYTTNYPILAAAGVMALIPPAILALVLNKRITGMLAGSS
jgi:multiple sugar transport system permease protein